MSAFLAVLEAKDLAHGPLEALITVDEEAGMTGAKGLEGGLLRVSDQRRREDGACGVG